MGATRIEWCDTVWNPVTGCTPISSGCANCYARRMATRLAGRCGYPRDDPFRVTLHHERLDEPLHWRKPRRVFVSSMGDLFHDDVPLEFIDRVMARVPMLPGSTFMVLTKRPWRMAKYFLESGRNGQESSSSPPARRPEAQRGAMMDADTHDEARRCVLCGRVFTWTRRPGWTLAMQPMRRADHPATGKSDRQ